jgi:hypothetical protein
MDSLINEKLKDNPTDKSENTTLSNVTAADGRVLSQLRATSSKVLAKKSTPAQIQEHITVFHNAPQVVKGDKTPQPCFVTTKQLANCRERALASTAVGTNSPNFIQLKEYITSQGITELLAVTCTNLLALHAPGLELDEIKFLNAAIQETMKWKTEGPNEQNKSSHRFPTLTNLFKTHKPTDRFSDLPCKTRDVIDTSPSVTAAISAIINRALKPYYMNMKSASLNTAEAVHRIESVQFRPEERESVIMIVADVVNHFPNADRNDCQQAMTRALEQHGPNTPAIHSSRIEALMALEAFAMDNVYFKADNANIYRLNSGYGIGVGHSSAATSIEWDERERALIDEVRQDPAHYGRIHQHFRQVDDALFIMTANNIQVENFKDRLNRMDLRRALTTDISREEIVVLDLTVFKGSKFHQTGVLDIRHYRKETALGMHLARTSYHPQSTFKSIMTGAADRILIASSNVTVWVASLCTMAKEFRDRGYGDQEVNTHLLSYRNFSDRDTLVKKIARLDTTSTEVLEQDVAVLKLPYTDRLRDVGTTSMLRILWEEACRDPWYGPATCGTRCLTALQTTSNLKAITGSR